MTDFETEPASVRDLEPGDRVLWGDRRDPLTVTDDAVHIDGAADLEGITAEGPFGGEYVVHEAPLGDPRVKRAVTPSARVPNGLQPEGYARDLRRVIE